MQIRRLMVTALVAVVAALPGTAAAASTSSHAPGHQGAGSGAKAAKGRGYGVLCRDESRKRSSGEAKSPFPACVTAMSHLVDKADRIAVRLLPPSSSGREQLHVLMRTFERILPAGQASRSAPACSTTSALEVLS
jgi:hypothetical protein